MTVFSITVLILLILFPLTIFVSHAENFDVKDDNDVIDVKRAEKLIDFGNYYGLLSYTQGMAQSYPDNVDVLFYRGVGLWGIGVHPNAISYQDRVLEINPAHKLALYYKSDSLYQLERYDESLQVIEQALRIEPTFQKGIIQKEKILSKTNQTFVIFDNPSVSKLLTKITSSFSQAEDSEKSYEKTIDPITKTNDLDWIKNFDSWWLIDYLLIGMIITIIGYSLKKRLNPI